MQQKIYMDQHCAQERTGLKFDRVATCNAIDE